jgi:hypothetical protein
MKHYHNWAYHTGRHPVPPLMERFRRRYAVDESGCWLWHDPLHKDGYGVFRLNGRMEWAHRAAYKLLVGPIPEGLQLDHLCRVRHCVNPAHLDPVTPAENNRRSFSPSAENALKTHCVNGHPFDVENTIYGVGRRSCRTCQRAAEHRYRERRKAA